MKFQIRHLNWILIGPSFAVWVYAWNIQIAQLLPANIVIIFCTPTHILAWTKTLASVRVMPPIYWRFCSCLLFTEVLPVPPIYWDFALASYPLRFCPCLLFTELLPVPPIYWGFARASYILSFCRAFRCYQCLLFTISPNIYLILVITMFYKNKIRFTNITSNFPHFLYYVYASGDGILMKMSNLMTNSIQTSMMGHIKSFTQS